MPDGVRLATDFYVPDDRGPFPCILSRTPYGKRQHRIAADAEGFAAQGFVVAVQDVRGAHESEGVFSVSANDGADGNATVDWLAGQEWCTGKIGTYGCSYLGENQLQLATYRNPNHAAMIAQSAGGANNYFGILDGGAHGLEWSVRWFVENGGGGGFEPPADLDYHELVRRLPPVDLLRAVGAPPTEWEDFIAREPHDPWWETRGYIKAGDRFDVPTLLIDSWFDPGVAYALQVHERMSEQSLSQSARDNQFAVISPTAHCDSETAGRRTIVGERDFGDARFNHYKLYVDWFDRWLRDRGPAFTSAPRVHYYLMGENAWKSAPEWPPAAVDVSLFLDSDGDARTRDGDGILMPSAPVTDGADTFVYDPHSPVPSLGGQLFDGAPDRQGVREQSEVERRDDVLVYTSPPLRAAVEVTGYLRVVLFVSSDAPDTDFTAKLIDVQPDGSAMNVQQGVIRARYRRGYREQAEFLEDGVVHRVEIDLHATAMSFGAGHRIRLQISSSDFPVLDRNLNTGGDNSRDTDWRVARNCVHHSAEAPSQLVLPVVAGELAFVDEASRCRSRKAIERRM